jgi:hypothetical protein
MRADGQQHDAATIKYGSTSRDSTPKLEEALKPTSISISALAVVASKNTRTTPFYYGNDRSRVRSVIGTRQAPAVLERGERGKISRKHIRKLVK